MTYISRPNTWSVDFALKLHETENTPNSNFEQLIFELLWLTGASYTPKELTVWYEKTEAGEPRIQHRLNHSPMISCRLAYFIDNKVCRHLARRTGLGGLDSSYTNEHNKSIIHANGTILARAITGYKNLPSQLFQMLWEMIFVRTWATVSKKKIQFCPVSGLAPSLTYDYPGSWCDGLIEWK